MKIYYLSHSRIPSRFANSVHVMRMCNAFAKQGHDVILFVKQGDPDAPQGETSDYDLYGVDPGFELLKISNSITRLISKFTYILKTKHLAISRGLPDLFYCRHAYCALWLTGMGIPIIFEAHQPPATIGSRLLQKRLLQHKDFCRLVVISEQLKNRYLQKYPFLNEDTILVAHDGADPVTSIPTLPDPWPGRPDSLQVGFMGQLYKGRGADLMIELAKRLPELDFHIIGGTEEDISYWKDVAGPTANLIFHGYVQNSLGPAYRDLMDVLIAPYKKAVATGGVGGRAKRTSDGRVKTYHFA